MVVVAMLLYLLGLTNPPQMALLREEMKQKVEELETLVVRQQFHIEALEEKSEQRVFEDQIRNRLSTLQMMRQRRAQEQQNENKQPKEGRANSASPSVRGKFDSPTRSSSRKSSKSPRKSQSRDNTPPSSSNAEEVFQQQQHQQQQIVGASSNTGTVNSSSASTGDATKQAKIVVAPGARKAARRRSRKRRHRRGGSSTFGSSSTLGSADDSVSFEQTSGRAVEIAAGGTKYVLATAPATNHTAEHYAGVFFSQ